MKSFIKQIGFFIIMFFFASFTACGGGGSSDTPAPAASGDQISFDAALSTSDYGISAKFTISNLISSKSTSGLKIVAIPISGFRSFISYGSDNFIIEAPVNSDGSFNLNLNKKIKLSEGEFPDGSTEFDTDYILMVVNEASDQIISFISMADFGTAGAINNSQTVVKLPISVASTAISLGTLTKDAVNIEAKSSSSTGGNFSLNINQLRQIAQSDDIAKAVGNDYKNQDLETKVFYYWNDTAVKTATNFEALITTFSDPTKFNFTGCCIGFWEMEVDNGKLGTFDDIKNKSTGIGLYPPSDVVSANTSPKTFGIHAPITNDGTMTGSGEWYNDDDFAVRYDDSRLGCVFGNGSNNLLTLPSGQWILRKQTEGAVTETSTQIGSFNFAVGNPFVDNNNAATSKLKTYVPAIQLTVSSGKITGLNIKWYLYNGSAYQEITDLTIMKRDGYEIGIAIRNNLGNDIITRLSDMPVEKTSYTSTDLVNSSGINPTLLDVTCIRLSLNAGPFAYDYNWRTN